MKKWMFRMAMLGCLALCAGCTDDKEGAKESSSIEIDVEQNFHTDLATEGGYYFIYDIVEDATQEEIDETLTKLRIRLGDYNQVYQAEDGSIVIEAPGVKDANEVLPVIETRGSLYFIPEKDEKGNSNFTDNAGTVTLNRSIEDMIVDGSIPLTGNEITKVRYEYQSSSISEKEPVILLELNEKGKEIFREMTEKAYKNGNEKIAIVYDGEVLVAPAVQSVIMDGRAVITAVGTDEEAARMVHIIEGGEIKLTFRRVQEKYVQPQE